MEAHLTRYLSLTNGISAVTKLFSAATPHKIISNLRTRILGTLLLAGILFTSPALAAGKGVVLNFNEVDISTMVKFISDLTGRNFVLDERVKGKISVFSPSKLSNEEAYNVFVSVLELKGFTVVQSGKVGKIVPSASAKQSGFTLLPSGVRAAVNENYVAQVNKLENISAQEALAFLQPMVSKDGHISAFGPGNLLLMVDSSLNIRKLQGLLRTIDTEHTREGFEIIYLNYASAESAAATIKQWLSGGEAKPAGQPATAGGGGTGSVLADQRLNALLVFGNENVKSAVRELVAKLDVQPPEASSKVNVYYLENTDATEMAKVLDGVVKGITAQATTGAPGAAAPQTSPFESGKVTITPDKGSNSLVIMASPNDYNNLIQVIKKLDRRSKQVFVQVLIAEVSLDKSRDLGVQGGVIAGGVLNKYLTVAGLYDPLGTLTSIGTALSAATGSALVPSIKASPVNVAAVLQALDKNGLVNILSTPNILTSDNKEAEINVGENVPFQGSTTLNTGFTTTSVDRKDIGINLKIKPQISEGDYIRLDINQEISAVKASKGQAIDLVTTKRSAKTSIVVKDMETVVIGGLIQDQEGETISKVPFLGDIPGLGWLFKTTNKTRQKTNLMILLTPHIIKDAADLAQVSDDQRVKFGESAKKVEPVDVQKEIEGKGSIQSGGVQEIPAK
jgi:general secretion pathway protein D